MDLLRMKDFNQSMQKVCNEYKVAGHSDPGGPATVARALALCYVRPIVFRSYKSRELLFCFGVTF